ncbi:hypothetical protein CWB99_05515 [Pseudoalteromonas rubra]|uniref:Porin n=1 Tax=Pseudoalteromonas rubra TaxID=43658 RepID=A0A5S3WPR6_9GAMM|nr:hypothetical protein [Pseudoalteromonas rubra]TMP30792.1 hypothetical protein CWB99_05515 [Pseudoalteromonas rubra]TMP34160.1 hypothetical protein CWC00_08345 [Pseudoalteromonas rubra]
MKQLPFLASMLSALVGAPAMAHSINFDKVEVGYKRFSADDSGSRYNDALTGVNLAASKRFENYYFEGRYYSVSDSFEEGYQYGEYRSVHSNVELDIRQFTFGLGYIHELDETSLFDVSFHIGRVDLKGEFEITETYLASVSQYNSSGSSDENIYRLRAQYQTRVLEDIELKAGLGYEKTDGDDGDDSNPLFFVGAGYHFTEMFSLNAEYRNVDEYNTLDVNFRYSF